MENLITKNYGYLKCLFNQISAKGSYPGISTFEVYENFVKKAKILDKNFNQASSDRLFISANYKSKEAPEVPGMSGNAICRFEFMEIIVRISREKFAHLKEPVSNSLDRLLIENVIPNVEPEK